MIDKILKKVCKKNGTSVVLYSGGHKYDATCKYTKNNVLFMLKDSEYEVIFYERPSKQCPMDEFLDGLQTKVRTKLMRWIRMLEKEGPNLPRPYADVVEGKIRELRTQFGSNEYRCLYFFDDKKIIMTHGFMKKTNKVPQNEIEFAENLMREYYHEKI